MVFRNKIKEYKRIRHVRKLAKQSLEEKWLNSEAEIGNQCAFCRDTYDPDIYDDLIFECADCYVDKRLCNVDDDQNSKYICNNLFDTIDHLRLDAGIEYIGDIEKDDPIFDSYELMVACMEDLVKHGKIGKTNSNCLNGVLNDD